MRKILYTRENDKWPTVINNTSMNIFKIRWIILFQLQKLLSLCTDCHNLISAGSSQLIPIGHIPNISCLWITFCPIMWKAKYYAISYLVWLFENIILNAMLMFIFLKDICNTCNIYQSCFPFLHAHFHMLNEKISYWRDKEWMRKNIISGHWLSICYLLDIIEHILVDRGKVTLSP